MKSQADKAQKLFDAALKAEDAGDLKQALRLYQQVAEIDKDSPIPGLSVACVLYDQGKWQDAIKAARQVTKRWPDSFHTHLLIARSYLEQGQLRRAERAFRQALALEPQPYTWAFLSHVLMRLGREDESIACLKSALKLDPNYEEAHYDLGIEYKLRGQNARAEKHLRRAIEIDPNYSLAYAELGWVLVIRKKELMEGVRLLKKAIKLDPNYGWARAYLGNALWTLRRFKAAEEQYRKLIEIWPDKAVSYLFYGSFLSSNGINDSLAESYFRKAIELDPKCWGGYYNLGKHLYYCDRDTEAVKYLKKALKQGDQRAARFLKEIETAKIEC